MTDQHRTMTKRFEELMEYKDMNNSSFNCDRDTIRKLRNGGGYISSLVSALDDMGYQVEFKPKNK